MLLPNHCTPVDCCLTPHQPLLEKEAENQGIQERRWRAGGCIHSLCCDPGDMLVDDL